MEHLIKRIVDYELIKNGMDDVERVIKLFEELQKEIPKIAVKKQKELNQVNND